MARVVITIGPKKIYKASFLSHSFNEQEKSDYSYMTFIDIIMWQAIRLGEHHVQNGAAYCSSRSFLD